jgi:hypothetical protein
MLRPTVLILLHYMMNLHCVQLFFKLGDDNHVFRVEGIFGALRERIKSRLMALVLHDDGFAQMES